MTTSTRVVRKLSGLIQQLKCSVPVLTRWKARGFPSPECDSDNSNPFLVVGGRAERQLLLEVMVYKARVSLLSYVSLCPMGEWLTLGSLQCVERIAPLRFLLKDSMLVLMSTSSSSVEIAVIFVQTLWTRG